jgi:hypothetical protein
VSNSPQKATANHRSCAGASARRALTAGVAIGALLSANLAYAEGPTFVAPHGGLKFHPRMLRAHPELNGRVAMYPHVQHTAAQAAAIKAKLDAAAPGTAAAATTTVPYWKSTFISPLDKQKYTYDMIGTNPYATTPKTWTVTVQPIIVKIKVGSTTFDPTAPSLCGDTASVETRFLQSPLFNPAAFVSNGVSVGTLQLPGAFMRANFWNVAQNTNYGVALHLKAAIVVTETVPGTVQSFPCGNGKNGKFGSIDLNTWSNDVQTLASKYTTPNQVSLILTYNVAEAAPGGGGYYLGWHDAFATSAGVQTYGTGSYFDPGLFSGIQDVSTWSHELDEWLDDPFVQENVAGGGNDNLTPAWGNVGQVVGSCQNNLEVGDPLSGTLFPMPTPAGVTGFTYHQQDLAFHDWFYRTPTDKSGTASNGAGGKYSFLGTFTGKEVPACTSSNQTTISNSQGASPRGNPRINQ